MKLLKLPMLLLMAATLATPLAALAADPHKHGSDSHKLELNAGKKWASDAPLRQAMTAIRTTVAATLPKAHSGKATPAEYEALGKEVGAQVAYIVQNCKLDPKADAQLHVIIGDLMNGVEMAEGKQPGKEKASGVVQMVQALNTYGQYFYHTGWKAIKLPH